MRRNDFLEIKALDKEALLLRAVKVREEIANLVLDKHMSKLKNVRVLAQKKKDLAQTLTVLRQKELLAELEVQLKPKVGEKSQTEKTKEGGDKSI